MGFYSQKQSVEGVFLNPVSHFSSLQSGIKSEFLTLLDNSNQLVGNGGVINFWHDNQCGVILAESSNLNQQQIDQYPKNLNAYIHDFRWSFLDDLSHLIPNLRNLVAQVTIPIICRRDRLVWNHNSKGDLTLKDAYHFKQTHLPKVNWAKLIWYADIPPSKYLLVWRFMMVGLYL